MKAKVERVPAGDRACGVVCEERPVFRLKTGSVLCVKARQRVRGQRERWWSKSDGKGDVMEAKERGNRSKIKKEWWKHMRTE